MINHSSRLSLFFSLALVASYWCVSPVGLHAQTVSGTILGQVQDQQGAAIGKAEVTARNLDTGAIRKRLPRTTARIGSPASLRVPTKWRAIAGFKTEVRSGIAVTVGADVAVNFCH